MLTSAERSLIIGHLSLVVTGQVQGLFRPGQRRFEAAFQSGLRWPAPRLLLPGMLICRSWDNAGCTFFAAKIPQLRAAKVK